MFYKLYPGVFNLFGLIALFSFWVPSTNGFQITMIPKSPTAGGSVLFDVTGITTNIKIINWYKGGNPGADYQILSYLPGLPNPMTKGVKYFPEASCFPNGSLHIINLKKAFEGDYTVQIQTDTLQQAKVSLTVNGIGYVGVSAPLLFLGVLISSALHMT
ncbi:carcinoembryonic antigen-related cell adhesion molecule 7-like [Spea bombifrons]|uniref:carcinoembryonic antigen-related cell adhesion molecule 7-like n=1 Tax=Spea bombifrons TaxID=233779 RepID=UPI0023490F6F|nr:carcinoembryonic antigen-related cell adhesion molecule 7-like [Spea bombifrons]